jgi:general stress protein YciG
MTLVDTAEIGRKGGKKRAENLSAEELREIGRKGAEARWGKAKKKSGAGKKKAAVKKAV